MKSQKAAMFGLDARIALAIFGALSLISGASLYSAIQESNAVALVAELNEASKAYEAYFVDTGRKPPLYTTGFGNAYDFAELTDNTSNIAGWAGPYLNFEYDAPSQKFTYTARNTTGLFAFFEQDDWGKGTAGADISCAVGELCAVFIELDNLPRALADRIDERVDGVKGIDQGDVRLHGATDDPINIYYRTNITFVR